ncbi:histidine kinase [Klebsiella variicola subsp. variicola]|nr:histidine kinase [Klebsiella variicola subsp. variicola]
MEWWVKKSTKKFNDQLLLRRAAERCAGDDCGIEACRLHLQEGDKLTPLANARYCLNNNPAQTLKILKATHYSSERWAKLGG